jgi:hypothetical protein
MKPYITLLVAISINSTPVFAEDSEQTMLGFIASAHSYLTETIDYSELSNQWEATRESFDSEFGFELGCAVSTTEESVSVERKDFERCQQRAEEIRPLLRQSSALRLNNPWSTVVLHSNPTGNHVFNDVLHIDINIDAAQFVEHLSYDTEHYQPPVPRNRISQDELDAGNGELRNLRHQINQAGIEANVQCVRFSFRSARARLQECRSVMLKILELAQDRSFVDGFPQVDVIKVSDQFEDVRISSRAVSSISVDYAATAQQIRTHLMNQEVPVDLFASYQESYDTFERLAFRFYYDTEIHIRCGDNEIDITPDQCLAGLNKLIELKDKVDLRKFWLRHGGTGNTIRFAKEFKASSSFRRNLEYQVDFSAPAGEL